MIRVLVVDDSAVVRKVLTEEISKYADFEVVGSAIDPYDARDKIIQMKPDVLTLDLEMPRMDGLSFLAKLMHHYPLPVVVVSSQAPHGSQAAMAALELGAVEVVPKPGSQFSVPDVGRHLVHALRAAAAARVTSLPLPSAPQAESRNRTVAAPGTLLRTTHKVIAIGASTGGTQAIEHLLCSLPADIPGIVITQHMPESFTAAFAERLNRICPMQVREARNGDAVVPGVALVAPGNKHMLLLRSGATYQVRVKDGPRIHHQRPSVDVLFQSVAQHAGPNAIGIILTGMGADGAKGLRAMHESGAHTIAQDEASCVVFGMPKEAIALGGVDKVLPLSQMAGAVTRALSGHA
jgi:two-component system chemotaxis response regulator CheB